MDASPAGSVERIIATMVGAIEAAPDPGTPFHHLVLDRIFPDDVYAAMIGAMPTAAEFRGLPGRGNANIRDDGTATRVKLDLFPEYIRYFGPETRSVWQPVGRALCSPSVRDAFVRRLAPGLKKRFGEGYARTGLFPIPMLTRDTTGYRIGEHTDTHWKGITVQLYLPRDTSLDGVGTVFSERLPDGSFRRESQMAFVPNHGYAFAVGDDTWHSVDAVSNLPMPRDSILLTYFVDEGIALKARNRAKRLGNLIGYQVRRMTARRG